MHFLRDSFKTDSRMIIPKKWVEYSKARLYIPEVVLG